MEKVRRYGGGGVTGGGASPLYPDYSFSSSPSPLPSPELVSEVMCYYMCTCIHVHLIIGSLWDIITE